MRHNELQERIRQAQAQKRANQPSTRTRNQASVDKPADLLARGGAGSAPMGAKAASTASGAADQQQSMGVAKPAGQGDEILACGYTSKEYEYLRQAIRAAHMQWFEGEGLILAKRDNVELHFRLGHSDYSRWVVMAFPVIDILTEE